MRIQYLLIFLLFPLYSMAQSKGTGSWNFVNIKYTINKKWSVFGETQLRSTGYYRDFHYYEYKFGIDYKLHKSLKGTIGAGSYQTFTEGGDFLLPKNNDEIRIWPQIALSQSIGSVNVEQRYRMEFRFTQRGYRNRYRYRLGASYPFGNMQKGYKPFVVSFSNELFFSDNEPYFERNRIQSNLQYRVTKTTALQLGYLHQFDYKINDETGRNFMILGIQHEIPSSK